MIYLDNSATSRFKPQTVFDAVEKEIRNSANPGRGGHFASKKASENVFRTRLALEEIFGGDEAIFTKNCTEALNTAILGALNDGGGEVITTYNEHNSVLRPLNYLQSIGKISVKYLIESPEEMPTVIKKSLNKNTRMVVVNHISNVTGEEQHITEIGKIIKENSSALFVVDAAQSLGHRKVNLKHDNIDLLAGAGHKGLHSPQGMGFLMINGNIKLNPLIFGGTGTESDKLSQPEILPEALESGTLNTPAIAGLFEGLKWTYSNFEKVNAHIRNLSKILYEELMQINGVKLYSVYDGGIISFNIESLDLGCVADYLSERYSICVRAGLHCAPLVHKKLDTLKSGLLRASIGFNNTLSDMEIFVKAIYNIAKFGLK